MTDATGRPAPQEFEKALTDAAATVASFDEDRLSVIQRVQRFLHVHPTTAPFVVLLLGLLLGVAVNPTRFTAASNISTVLTQVMVTGILGVGQTLVILTAGIDLSVGVIMVISSVVMGRPLFSTAYRLSSHFRSAFLSARLSVSSMGRWSPASECRRSSSRSARSALSGRSTPFIRRAKQSACRTSMSRRRFSI